MYSISRTGNKYRNKKVVVDGITFDSKKEAKRYTELKLMQEQGLIADLQLQYEFVLIDKFKLNGKTYRKTSYIADFRYFSKKDDKIIVEDVKSPITAKDKVYALKKKMLANRYGIEIVEI